VDGTGPFPLLLGVLIFVGVRRDNWSFLCQAMVGLAVVLSAVTLLSVAGLQTFTRQEGVTRLGGILNALFWPASWLVMKNYAPDSPGRYFRFLPILVYALGTVYTQTRLNGVMLIGLLIVNAYVQHRRGKSQGAAWIAGLFLIAWFGLFTMIFLRDLSSFDGLRTAATAFEERLDEDSRTGQLRRFFDDVEPEELLLGRGSLATWTWPGMVEGSEWTGGTDIGYLSLLFFGGLPLLLGYIAVVLAPCFRVLRMRHAGWQLGAAGVVALWGLRLFSSGYPGMSLESYPVLFFVGACVSTETFDDRSL
jgi:hypothetical protein